MSAQYQLRPVELCDLPTLKRWRELPSVQSHLRHPNITWFQHLKWWWRIRRHADPTCRVWAVVKDDVLVGQAGLYYRMGPAAEVSVLMVVRGIWAQDLKWYEVEDCEAEREIVHGPLTEAALAWGLDTLWAEVLATAPFRRHDVFTPGLGLSPLIWADSYSTIYRWRIA